MTDGVESFMDVSESGLEFQLLRSFISANEQKIIIIIIIAA